MNRLALSLTLLAACAGGAAPASAPSPAVGKPLSFDLPTNVGAIVSVPPRDVRATIVAAWTPACVACRTSLPRLAAKKSELEAAGTKLVLVAVLAAGETTERAAAALHSWGVDAPFLVDRGGALRTGSGVSDLPITLVIDRLGTLQWIAPPGASADDVIRTAAEIAH